MIDPETSIARRFADQSTQSKAMLKHTIDLWHKFNKYGLAVGNFVDGICDQRDATFRQHYWEMLLADHLIQRGFVLERPSKGPDFRFKLGSRVVWVEATAPEPGTGPDRVPDRLVDPISFMRAQRQLDPNYKPEAFSVPTDRLILRWSSAIRTKWRRWTAYVTDGIVNEADIYVIAINACNLGFAGLHGTEDYEIAVRSVFLFGDIKVTWNTVDDEIVKISREHKTFIPKHSCAEVPTNLFLDDTYSCISAIIGTNTSPLAVPLGRSHFEFAVIHNPLASARLKVGALGGNVEFVPHEEGDGYRLDLVRS